MAVAGLTAVQRRAGPATPAAVAKPAACHEEMARRTSGLDLVLAICASHRASCRWLRVLAGAEPRAVATAVDKRTGRVGGVGESATPDMAVRTTRTVSVDFESWR